MYPMCNGVQLMVESVIRVARAPGSITLLRIYGGGGAGLQNVSVARMNGAREWAGIAASNLCSMRPVLARLTPYLCRSGRVHLLGAGVGEGEEGSLLLHHLANIWQVPIFAFNNTRFWQLHRPDGPEGDWMEESPESLRVAYPTGGEWLGKEGTDLW